MAAAATPMTSTGARSAARSKERSVSQTASRTSAPTAKDAAATRTLTDATIASGYPQKRPMLSETNYSSGEDYEIEFLGYRFAFNAYDFEQRVTAAAVKLGLVASNELDED